MSPTTLLARRAQRECGCLRPQTRFPSVRSRPRAPQACGRDRRPPSDLSNSPFQERTPSIDLSVGLQNARHRLEGEQVAMSAESADHAVCSQAYIRDVAKILAAKNVGKMHLDDRHFRCLERVEDGDRRVRISPAIQNDAVSGVARLLDPIDELTFVIGLSKIDREL